MALFVQSICCSHSNKVRLFIITDDVLLIRDLSPDVEYTFYLSAGNDVGYSDPVKFKAKTPKQHPEQAGNMSFLIMQNQIDRHVGRQTARQTDRLTQSQTDKQIDELLYCRQRGRNLDEQAKDR